MSTTTFVNGVTLTDASWFNDVNAVTYNGTFPAGITALSFTGATTLTAFAGATTLLTLGGTGATAVVAIPGTLEWSGTTGALTVAGGVYIAKKLNVVGTLTTAAISATGNIRTSGGDVRATDVVFANTGTTLPAGGSSSVGFFLGDTALQITAGSGAPTFTAVQGSLYLRTDGTVGNRLYVNNNGSTGWTAY